MFSRVEVSADGLNRPERCGDGWLANPTINNSLTTGDITLLASDIQGGVTTVSALTTAQVVTFDTAANILAAVPSMDIGDRLVHVIANLTTNAIAALTTSQGVTLAGLAGLPASLSRDLLIEKTSATAVKVTSV